VTRFRARPERSRLSIEAKSSLHPIHGEATGLRGELEVEIRDGRLDETVPPKARIELPVERLRSGNTLMDMETRRRIDARKFPTITAGLREVRALDRPDRYRAWIDLTLHGVTRRLPADVTARLDGENELSVEADLRLDVHGFGITPPRLLGLRVDPEVKVHAHLVAEEQGG
jgi:polyisoprenoid-binding protein YceI